MTIQHSFKLLLVILGLGLFIFTPQTIHAQEEAPGEPGESLFQGYVRGSVAEVITSDDSETLGQKILRQTLQVTLTSGNRVGEMVEVEYRDFQSQTDKSLRKGDKLVLAQVNNYGETTFEIVDRYRLPSIYVIVGMFVLITLLAARGKGFTALVSLAATMFVILKFLVPQILSGGNPVWITLQAASVIALIIFFVGHGISKRTTLAFISTLIASGIGIFLATIFSSSVRLFGVGSEETQFVQNFFQGAINLRGLLLAGIVIGMLGILDDVTTAQAAAVEELKKANPDFTFRQLYSAGYRIGQEHITGLVNTLFLVYSGVALPLFLLFSVNTNQPAWVLLNSEYVAEEIVRTLVGSISLVLAVPLTTAISAYYFSRKKKEPITESEIVVIAAEDITVMPIDSKLDK